jgi:hypothetical protein
MDWIAISGWFMTAVGLGIAGVQTYRTKRLQKRNREQLTMFIEDANYVSFEHELLDVLAEKFDDPMLMRYVVSVHQRGCDLYRGLVDYYLSFEKRFTFEDLRRVCQTAMITYPWQEEVWRGRLAMRAENRNIPMPQEPFLAVSKSPRYRQYQQRDGVTTAGSRATRESESASQP